MSRHIIPASRGYTNLQTHRHTHTHTHTHRQTDTTLRKVLRTTKLHPPFLPPTHSGCVGFLREWKQMRPFDCSPKSSDRAAKTNGHDINKLNPNHEFVALQLRVLTWHVNESITRITYTVILHRRQCGCHRRHASITTQLCMCIIVKEEAHIRHAPL